MSRDEGVLIKSRVISKTRVIAGLLAEMDAAGALVIIRSSEDSSPISIRLYCEFRIPFESSTLKIHAKDICPGVYSAVALFAGQRITFDLNIYDDQGNCHFPLSMTILDLRRSLRHSFGSDVQSAEIWCKHTVIFATPIDFSQNSMALVSVISDPPLQIGDDVDIKVRGDGLGRDVYSFSMTVHDIEKTETATRILLGFPEDSNRDNPIEGRRTTRQDLTGVSLSISPTDEHIGGNVVCNISNFSLTGLRCELKDVPNNPWFVPGVHVKIQGSDVHGTLMWCTATSVGIRLDALDDSTTLASWMALLKQLAPHYSVHSSRVDQLIGLFTESGLLKGSRRKIYGAKPGKFLPPELVTSNPLLYHRVASSLNTGRFIGQVSMVRLTDDFWFLQEGAHTGESEGASYDVLLSEVQKIALDLASTSVLAPRYVGGLVHKTVKSSVNYLEKYMGEECNGKFKLLQMSMSSNFQTHGKSVNTGEYVNVGALSADCRRKAFNQFSPLISEIFGGLNGTHPRLNAELSKLGPHHKAETILMKSHGVVWGLAYRLRSYYSLSSTGVVNSVYFTIRAGTDMKLLRSGLNLIIGTQWTQGTDDLVLIIDPIDLNSPVGLDAYFKAVSAEFPNGKEFSLYVIDGMASKKSA